MAPGGATAGPLPAVGACGRAEADGAAGLGAAAGGDTCGEPSGPGEPQPERASTPTATAAATLLMECRRRYPPPASYVRSLIPPSREHVTGQETARRKGPSAGERPGP